MLLSGLLVQCAVGSSILLSMILRLASASCMLQSKVQAVASLMLGAVVLLHACRRATADMNGCCFVCGLHRQCCLSLG
jgi:hypothetical protein